MTTIDDSDSELAVLLAQRGTRPQAVTEADLSSYFARGGRVIRCPPGQAEALNFRRSNMRERIAEQWKTSRQKVAALPSAKPGEAAES
jgi:hypothetical protein